ncbi:MULTISPECIES: hypothetical protein [unclassified Streptomyces]|uniref:hypothetical protein n=1 Tax=unclassified Streptomyces TaxID=2593676 RepID=UPI0011657562|nr:MULTISPECIES: hypothetical protein [unclassified Streptomyces]NMI57101.1 hypothetical protein [Streptomyces sp. RLA2-12]QDN56481.1 hypothetical protein FNV67_15305 [Streptomyces sp. S1D4-20]QDN66658.1 hypothetical protein FNV66_14900 [Streptomyces sp. S1D4-14]QDO49065.1 hypothetical protein FNV60_13150 [Streptomyces sp. RLB3-5]QDO59306.1 hypothetical protein FNV59_15395 [Streptomyces sp. RLB1-8]
MADEQTWAQRTGARMVRTSDEVTAEQDTEAPAWARVLADRANGRVPDPELVAEAQRTSRPPRTEMERKLLERLGYGDEPPAA